MRSDWNRPDTYDLPSEGERRIMLRVAYEEGEAEILTAILSCAYSYELIAKKMVKNNPDFRCHRTSACHDAYRQYAENDSPCASC